MTEDTKSAKPTPVVLFQDGAIDELVSVALLASMHMENKIDFVSCVITDADCHAVPTFEATKKLLAFLQKQYPNAAKGTDGTKVLIDKCSRGVNPFPWQFRRDSLIVNKLPMLNSNGIPNDTKPKKKDFAGPHKMWKPLKEKQNKSVTVLCLGPLTPLAAMLQRIPRFKKVVKEIIWMGGAIDVGGNVFPAVVPGANKYAEWNAYWDPFAVETLFRSDVKIKMFPLDLTNDFPVNDRFFSKWIYHHSGDYPVIDLIGQMYALAAFQEGYCFWDTATTSYLARPEWFLFEKRKLGVVTDQRSKRFGSIIAKGSCKDCKIKKMSYESVHVAKLPGCPNDAQNKLFRFIFEQLIKFELCKCQ